MEQETSNEMKTANNDKAGVSGSCFWGHRWTKWEQYNANLLLLSDMKTELDKNEKLSMEQETSPIANVLLGAVYSFPNYMIEHIIELSQEYEEIVSISDIEKFKNIATVYDETHINQLISNCVNWTMKKDWDDKYQQKLKRDEIKTLERVKYRVERGR